MKKLNKISLTLIATILTFSLTYVILKKETNNKRKGVAPFDFSLEDHIHLNKEIK
ncbi:RinB-like transcriptional activator [Staphylococcus phage PG-2021_87]